MNGFKKLNLKKLICILLVFSLVFTDTSFATPFISTADIPDKMNFEQYITKMYELDEGDAKYIEKLEDAVYDYKNRYTMYVDHDYVLGKQNAGQAEIVYYQPGVQEPPSQSGGGGGGENLEVGEIDAGEAVTPPCGEWYNDASGMEVDSTPEELYGGIKYYTGLPWPPASNTYFFDTDVSTEDAYNWINSQGSGSLSKSADWAKTHGGRICHGCGYTVPQYLRGPGWHQLPGAYVTTIDGVDCVGVAPPPCVVDPTYNNGFQPGTWQVAPTPGASVYNYGQKKMCIVLEGDAGTIYVPCTPADAKGHTFPGGVFQTSVKAGGVNGNAYSVYVAGSSGDAGGGLQVWPGNQMASLMNTVNAGGANPVQYTYNVCETYGWTKGLEKALSQSFRVIGYVVWP